MLSKILKATLDKYIEKFIKEQNIPGSLLQLYIIKMYSSLKRGDYWESEKNN